MCWSEAHFIAFHRNSCEFQNRTFQNLCNDFLDLKNKNPALMLLLIPFVVVCHIRSRLLVDRVCRWAKRCGLRATHSHRTFSMEKGTMILPTDDAMNDPVSSMRGVTCLGKSIWVLSQLLSTLQEGFETLWSNPVSWKLDESTCVHIYVWGFLLG